ncbi:hypothetical protein [Nocardioides sp. AE5]|uniref:hypothetical protein n=1 Tax=Nocardioides sp. AE5 TaxID=2962573 RepID=UPI002881F944|nr:hypothetical protein [Nocardioides sp. AE5]MDT0202031.1 hypothetical protein [Nocardioides sp. AE5]
MTQPPADMKLQRSSRSAAETGERIAAWLGTVMPEGSDPEVVVHEGIQTNGMSSETVLLAITAGPDGERTTTEYVARVEPAVAAPGTDPRRGGYGGDPDWAHGVGGFKASGLGREFGPEGLAQYAALKSVYLSPPPG